MGNLFSTKKTTKVIKKQVTLYLFIEFDGDFPLFQFSDISILILATFVKKTFVNFAVSEATNTSRETSLDLEKPLMSSVHVAVHNKKYISFC